MFEPVTAKNFIGDTRQGSPVNFYNTFSNPHGNGTHTECVGHIANERIYINNCLKNFNTIGLLITIEPQSIHNDFVITLVQLKEALLQYNSTEIEQCKSLIIRTLPNLENKTTTNYSGKNPPYIEPLAMQYIVDLNFEHLIVDLPSVDKEQDNGALAAHHIFWNYPANTRLNATITEMVYVPNTVIDDKYWVSFQIMPIELDASSSKIILYKMVEE